MLLLLKVTVSAVLLAGCTGDEQLSINAKNRLGAYTGQSTMAIIMREGRVVHSVEETGWMFCQGVSYEPFPELTS